QRWLDGNGDSCKMIMQVHDELVFEVAESDVEHCRENIAGLMTGAAELSVGLEVDAGIGTNWNQAH
ncbi:MAG: hypothetical protein GY802_18755, partial [Gammaproteobacteria bacterium]|nr:hypothetical protein [Gammaproteobacteria bacterium]